MSSRQYQLIDSGHFRKLEQVGPYRLIRPSLSAVWEPRLGAAEWKKADAEFLRLNDGDGEWKTHNKNMPDSWMISVHDIQFIIKLTGFGHLGIFAEQTSNWIQIEKIVAQRTQAKKTTRVLNLFAYTGGSSLFCARAGAEVTHVDASKVSVKWAQDNALASKLDQKPVRWLIDDAQEFIQREVRRGKTYHGLILDPPSYGRGHKNQLWKIEKHLLPMLKELKKLMDPDFSFLLFSSHSPGYTPAALRNLCQSLISKEDAQFDCQEMLITENETRALPSGAYCLSYFS